MDITPMIDEYFRTARELPLPAAVLDTIAAEAAGWEDDKAAVAIQGQATEVGAELMVGARARINAVKAAILSMAAQQSADRN
jgi:hypothetical protein